MAPRMRRRITSAKREEIEKEQEALSRSIVRPFDVVAGLPVSYNTPPYGHYEDVLKNPLTVKDSGILYRSLMKSRYNYVQACPMFKLYWVKQSSYARKLLGENKPVKTEPTDRPPILGGDVNARDVMVKLCDSGLSLGPHSFEIRIFIAKDDRSKKSDEEGEEKKRETEEKGSEAETKKDEDSAESTVKVKQEADTDRKAGTDREAVNEVSQKETAIEADKETQNDKANDTPKDEAKSQNEDMSKDTPKDTPATNTPSDAMDIDPATKSSSQPPDETSTIVPSQTASEGTTAIADSQDTVPSSSQAGTNANISTPGTSTTTNEEKTDKTEKPTKPKKRAANDLESEDNKLMIANLNSVAKVDSNLHELMKIVSEGNPTTQQLMRFSGYVSRAREMGPPPHPFLIPNFRMDPYQPFRSRKPPKEKKDKKALKLNKQPTKEQRLTAFQEKYFSDATLVFEFVENPNVRYLFPKYAICEVLPSKLSSEERDILISFLWIHNQNELDAYNKQLEEYNNAIKEKERKEKEEEEKKKAEEERQKQIAEGKVPEGSSDAPSTAEAETLGPASSRTRRRPPPKKQKAKKAASRAPKALVAPEVPELRFTPVSYVIHDIPIKFVPIIINSFKPEKESYEFMKHVIEKGSRSSSLNLWYQVDGKLDEELAENTRVELINEEKKSVGFNSAAANAAKKRKL